MGHEERKEMHSPFPAHPINNRIVGGIVKATLNLQLRRSGRDRRERDILNIRLGLIARAGNQTGRVRSVLSRFLSCLLKLFPVPFVPGFQDVNRVAPLSIDISRLQRDLLCPALPFKRRFRRNRGGSSLFRRGFPRRRESSRDWRSGLTRWGHRRRGSLRLLRQVPFRLLLLRLRNRGRNFLIHRNGVFMVKMGLMWHITVQPCQGLTRPSLAFWKQVLIKNTLGSIEKHIVW